MKTPVIIREVGCREGFQNHQAIVPSGEKIGIIDLLSATGIGAIEVAAFVRPDRVPQMADAKEIVAGIRRREGVRYTALYLNPKGFHAAEAAGVVDNEGWIPASVSETFLMRNSNLTFEAFYRTVQEWAGIFAAAQKSPYGLMVSAAFGANDEGPIEPERIAQLVTEVETRLGGSLTEVCLADTMGWGTPDRVKRGIAAVRRVSTAQVSLHLHDTRGMGIANVVAGLEEGVRIFEASLGGVGGCPFVTGAAGNVATEEVLFLCEESGYATGIDLDLLCQAVEELARVMKIVPPSRMYRAWKALR
jgi:hydroxymethylglutaryl-CoA lyase